MASIGTKTQTAPEIGDLVVAKASKTYIYEDSDALKIKEEVPAGTELGMIIMIAPHETGVDLYVVDNGAVFADEVTTKANPVYNYGSEPSGTTADNGGGFWGALNKVLDLGVGIFTRKKSTPSTDGDTEDTTVADDETETPQGRSSLGVVHRGRRSRNGFNRCPRMAQEKANACIAHHFGQIEQKNNAQRKE